MEVGTVFDVEYKGCLTEVRLGRPFVVVDQDGNMEKNGLSGLTHEAKRGDE